MFQLAIENSAHNDRNEHKSSRENKMIITHHSTLKTHEKCLEKRNKDLKRKKMQKSRTFKKNYGRGEKINSKHQSLLLMKH